MNDFKLPNSSSSWCRIVKLTELLRTLRTVAVHVTVALFFPVIAMAQWTNINDAEPIELCPVRGINGPGICLLQSPDADVSVATRREGQDIIVTLTSVPLPSRTEGWPPGRAFVGGPCRSIDCPLEPLNCSPEQQFESCEFLVKPRPALIGAPSTYWYVLAIGTERQICTRVDENFQCDRFDWTGSVVNNTVLYIDTTPFGGTTTTTLPPPPRAAFTHSKDPNHPLTIHFDASASTGLGPLSYEWDPGTGDIDETFDDPFNSYTYEEPGTYTVTITVTDRLGQTDSVSKQIEVGDFSVTLQAIDRNGMEVNGNISLDQTLDVTLTITNGTDETLSDFAFTGGELMVVDPRSPGGATIVAGPTPNLSAAGITLPSGEHLTVEYRVTTTARGIVGIHTEVSATDESGVLRTDASSLKLEIEDGSLITQELEKFLLLQIAQKVMEYAYSQYYEGFEEAAGNIRDSLAKVLTPTQMKSWFGKRRGFQLSNDDYADAEMTGTSPRYIDATRPDGTVKGVTREEALAALERGRKQALRNSAKNWVDGWVSLGRGTKNVVQHTYSEALKTSYNLFGVATPEEQLQFLARTDAIRDAPGAAVDSIIETAAREIPMFKENTIYFGEAVGASFHQSIDTSIMIKERVVQELHPPDTKLLDTDPIRFYEELGKHEVKPITAILPLILDGLLGGGTAKVGSVTKNVVMKNGGAAIVKSGRAIGVLDDTGRLVKRKKTKIRRSDAAEPSGLRPSTAARNSEEFLENLDGATVVGSGDLGKVYELPNLGGVPETSLDVKAGILQELEGEFLKTTGTSIEIAEVLKPSSALRKNGGVAKLELTAQKTGKPEMIDAGMPADALGEANVWRNTVHPKDQPGWKNLSRARKEAATKEWKKANERWDEWDNPPRGSKTEKLKQCIGQECRVPLDDAPNRAGFQRFVTAEYEVVNVTKGTAEARLIRVKKYKIEVVDTTRNNLVVNQKTVVNSNKALPQTPDADAVALAKVVGRDVDGNPILAPLSRKEREFVVQRYIDKTLKARRAGLLPDGAEHGVTLIMDDAGAAAAGFLVPSYGATFLPRTTALRYLRRIAPWVKSGDLTNTEMLFKMLALVQSQGGFGQRAVVVTRHNRYFGRLNVSEW